MSQNSPIRQFKVHIKHAYNESSPRGSVCMRDSVNIMDEKIHGATPALKIRMIGIHGTQK